LFILQYCFLLYFTLAFPAKRKLQNHRMAFAYSFLSESNSCSYVSSLDHFVGKKYYLIDFPLLCVSIVVQPRYVLLVLWRKALKWWSLCRRLSNCLKYRKQWWKCPKKWWRYDHVDLRCSLIIWLMVSPCLFSWDVPLYTCTSRSSSGYSSAEGMTVYFKFCKYWSQATAIQSLIAPY